MFNGLEFVVEPAAASGELENKVTHVKSTITSNAGVLSRIVTEEVRTYFHANFTAPDTAA